MPSIRDCQVVFIVCFARVVDVFNWRYNLGMKKVPYERNRGNSCALSCYTMVARYLFPDAKVSFDDLAKIAGFRVGYVVWGFPVWQWMIDRGAEIVDYDVVDYEAWAREGLEGYQKSVSAEHFGYVAGQTFDIEKDTQNLQKLFGDSAFSFVRKKVDWSDLVGEYEKPGICEVTLDAAVLDDGRGGGEMSLHRVVLLGMEDGEVVFHDPNMAGTGAYRRVPTELFREAFLAVPDGAEICRYGLKEKSSKK